MGRRTCTYNRLCVIVLFILVILFSCVSPYYITHGALNSFRVKKTEDISAGKNSSLIMINSSDANYYDLESINPQAAYDDIILLLLNNKMITMDILLSLLLIYQLYRSIRRRNILMSQIKNKFYVVRCLQQKDGKKGTSYQYGSYVFP